MGNSGRKKGISNCYTFCNMGRSEKADQEIIDVIDELIWELEDVAERVAKRQARRTKRTYDRELEDFLGKFQKWFSSAGDWHGAEEKARKALVAKRQKAHAEAQRIKDHNAWNPAHPDMVWAVNNRDNIFYRHGKKGKWSKVPGGLKQISASKSCDAVWGVARNGTIWYRQNTKANWENVPGRLIQVAVGTAGVYGVNRSHMIWYRNGTNKKPDSKGTGWTRLPGALKNIAVGRNGLWGANKKDMIYWAARGSKPGWEQIPGGLKQISAF